MLTTSVKPRWSARRSTWRVNPDGPSARRKSGAMKEVVTDSLRADDVVVEHVESDPGQRQLQSALRPRFGQELTHDLKRSHGLRHLAVFDLAVRPAGPGGLEHRAV